MSNWRALMLMVLISMPAGTALALQPVAAFVLLAEGEGVTQELADDITEAVGFAVGRDKGLKFMPKEKLQMRLGYSGPMQVGDCVFNQECLRRTKKELDVRWFVVGLLKRDSDGKYPLLLKLVADTPAQDETKSVQTLGDPSELINQTRQLLTALVTVRLVTLVFSVNHADAQVAVNGREVAHGSGSISVNPGRYKVRVTKDGFVPFETFVKCLPDTECVVTATLRAEGGELQVVTSIEDPGFTWRIVGWSATGIGIGLVVAGVAFGAKSRALEDELKADCVDGQCATFTEKQVDNKRQAGADAAEAGNVTGALGTLVLLGGVTSLIVGYMMKPDSPQPESNIQIEPVVGLDGSLLFRARIKF